MQKNVKELCAPPMGLLQNVKIEDPKKRRMRVLPL